MRNSTQEVCSEITIEFVSKICRLKTHNSCVEQMVCYRWNDLPLFFTYMYKIMLYVMEYQCLEFVPGIRQK